MRLGFNHLHEHQFRSHFHDTLNLLCDCGNGIEKTTLFFRHCPNFLTPRQTLLNNIKNINKQILSDDEVHLTQMFLYSNLNYNLIINRLILNSKIEYLISTERFKFPVFFLIWNCIASFRVSIILDCFIDSLCMKRVY